MYLEIKTFTFGTRFNTHNLTRGHNIVWGDDMIN